MASRLMVSFVASGAFLLMGVTGLAQEPPFTNLQVWPKDTSRAVILQFMNAFDESLGVQCNYCHVQQGGRFDFASDEKREKRVARQMILLRDSINVVLPAIVGKPAGAGPTAGEGQRGAPVRVLCSSCHRGLPIPRAIADVVTEAGAAGGASVGLAKFRELRGQYYGGQQYDFSEGALLTIAQRALTAKNPDGAILYLQANAEYFPKSARTYQALAQARLAKGDTQAAIASLEKALELDATNDQVRSQLQQLRGR